MKNQTNTSLERHNQDAKGLSIDLQPRKKQIIPPNKLVEIIEEPQANKWHSKLNQQISKLIKMYSTRGSVSGLTREQFKVLANDLYSSVDKERDLTEEELSNLVNLLDTDKNQEISREQILALIQDEKLSLGQNSNS